MTWDQSIWFQSVDVRSEFTLSFSPTINVVPKKSLSFDCQSEVSTLSGWVLPYPATYEFVSPFGCWRSLPPTSYAC